MIYLSGIGFLAAVAVISSKLPTALSAELPFTYLNATTENGYGVEDWNQVKESQYYFDWDRFYYKDGFDDNECQWRPNGKSHHQSPIDVGKR